MHANRKKALLFASYAFCLFLNGPLMSAMPVCVCVLCVCVRERERERSAIDTFISGNVIFEK